MKYLLLLLLLSLSPFLRAQALIGDLITFEGAAFANWSTEGMVDFTTDGRATATPFWGARGPIDSDSRLTALILEGRPEELTKFKSPFLDFSGETEVWLGFHQYYRQNDGGDTRIEIRQDGALRRTIPLNEILVPGAETGENDTILLDLTDVLAGEINMQVDFVFTGRSYFWLLDDIGFYDGDPSPGTVPPTMGEYLDEQGYPFKVDSANWAYVPQQLVIQFAPDASQGFRDSLQQELGAAKIDSCACGFIELWEIDGTLFQSQGGQQEPATGTTGILSNIKKAKAKSKVDGVDLNTYNLTQPVPATPAPAQPIADFSGMGFASEEFSSIRIAILDTGVDYNNPKIKRHVPISSANVPTSGIDDMNCLDNDGIGWNFVDSNNNPYDDNGHGTHVAGILVDSLEAYGGTGCDYEIVTYKTHDFNGVSTLFDVACATFQASLDDVDIINDSWGFFGDSSIILSNAIDTAAARNILIVSAAGNDAIDLDTLRQYPACYSADNVITVAASNTFVDPNGILTSRRADFSNFSPNFVDIVAPGVNILSAVPGGLPDTTKSGTSMATPMVSAEAAIVLACLREGLSPDQYGFQPVKDSVLNEALRNADLSATARNGWFLAYSESCNCAPSSTAPETRAEALFEVFPNPFGNTLTLRSLGFRGGLRLRLLDASGKEVYRQRGTDWLPGTTQSITLPNLKAGMYFLQLSGNGYSWAEKLLRF